MVPRIAPRGSSFKGAGLYYLHDKHHAQTAERVGWTHTENVPTQDPELALRWMAYTAMHADELKRQAGGNGAGRKTSKPVFCLSLSWHPEQEPTQDHMIETGRSVLAALGLTEHQAVMVSHNDEAYRHLHLITCTVHPQTGRSHTPSYSKLTLSQWAEAYEREHGKIYCEQRAANNARREEGEYVKYQDAEIDQKTLITKLYREAKDAQAFRQAVEQHGFKLARGKKLLLIDREGKVHSLARQIADAREKDLRAYLRGVQLKELAAENERQEQARRKREEEEKTRQERNKKRAPAQAVQPLNTAAQQAKSSPENKTHAERQARKPEGYFGPPLPSTTVRLENRQRDELDQFRAKNRLIKERWMQQAARKFGAQEECLRSQIAAQKVELEGLSQARRLWLSARGKLGPMEERLAGMRAELAAIEDYKAQRQARDEYEAREHLKGLQALQERHERERQALHNDPKAWLRREGREFNERSAPETRLADTERPLVELPATLRAKIEEGAAPQRQARPSEPPKPEAAKQESPTPAPANDNRSPEQRAFNQAAQKTELSQQKSAPANDNRRTEARPLNPGTQGRATGQRVDQRAQPQPGRSEQPRPETAPAARSTDEQKQFAQTLQGYGLSEAEARRLAAEKPDACRAKIPAIPFLPDSQNQQNRAGYIRAFLEREEWQVPAAYLEAQQAQRSAEIAEDLKQGQAARESCKMCDTDGWRRVVIDKRQPNGAMRQCSHDPAGEKQWQEQQEKAHQAERRQQLRGRTTRVFNEAEGHKADPWKELQETLRQQPAPGRNRPTTPAVAPDPDKAAREALLDQWSAASQGRQRSQTHRAQTPEQGQAVQEAPTEDAALYTLLDQWNAQQSQQQVREQAQREGERNAGQGEAGRADGAPAPEDAERHALLDQWAGAQERGLERGMTLEP